MVVQVATVAEAVPRAARVVQAAAKAERVAERVARVAMVAVAIRAGNQRGRMLRCC